MMLKSTARRRYGVQNDIFRSPTPIGVMVPLIV